jgi:hypothetical protein
MLGVLLAKATFQKSDLNYCIYIEYLNLSFESFIEIRFRGFYALTMRGMFGKHGIYPMDYDEFKAFPVWWRNEFNDFCVVAEATFIMAQYLATYPALAIEFFLVSNDYDLRMRYNQSEELQHVLGQLKITRFIDILSFEDVTVTI